MRLKSEFENSKDFYSYLISNKSEILDTKKQSFKKCDGVSVNDNNSIVKSLQTNNIDDLSSGVIKRTVIGNTYNWLDSHGDVHLDGTFSNSIKQRGDKVRHYHDHIQQISAKVGEFEKVYEKTVNWSDLGIEKKGTTTVLLGNSNIEKSYNSGVFSQYLKNKIDQHSVGMYYVKIDIAINDEEYPQEKALFDSIIDKIGNKEKALELGYFFAVKEAKLIEISAVPNGSNEITQTIENVNPSKGNLDIDPSEDSQESKNINFKLKKLC